ncbi:unnamed protein product, partial [Ceratitis capitata]
MEVKKNQKLLCSADVPFAANLQHLFFYGYFKVSLPKYYLSYREWYESNEILVFTYIYTFCRFYDFAAINGTSLFLIPDLYNLDLTNIMENIPSPCFHNQLHR